VLYALRISGKEGLCQDAKGIGNWRERENEERKNVN
jgi:hypothetical protein